MKRIVVCCDGTWERPDQVVRGKVRPSNVAKFAHAVAPEDSRGAAQRVYYRSGVGTGRFDHFRGGAFGWGLSQNIRDAYGFLVAHYEPGDEIFLFGFSRGAYTVRSLAGLVRNCGLLRREHVDRVEEAYRLYRRRDPDSSPRSIEAELFRRTYAWESRSDPTRVRCVVVWDTVGALGIPVGWVGTLSRRVLRLQFHDVKLSSYVDNAFHALAIDESRRPFAPTLWDGQAHAAGQRLEQMWFAGVHTNVGGGYEDTGLSDIAFLWMKERAQECGLVFREGYIRQAIRPNVLGVLEDSGKGIYRLIAPYVRPIPARPGARTFETVHPSAYERFHRCPDYRPPNLPKKGVPVEPAPALS